MISIHDILAFSFPGRGGWIVDGDLIMAGDGGAVPTLSEIEAQREAAETFWTAKRAEQAIKATREALVLTRAQFGEMLIRRGIKAQVIEGIAAIQNPIDKQIMEEWFEYTPTVRRVSPKVESFRTLLGISESLADQWFTEAMAYE